MKKVILCATALLIGGVAMAQDGAVAPKKAVEATPNIAIAPDLNANYGVSSQDGTSNKVYVAQAGSRQSVWTVQSNGTGIGGNQISVTQTGLVTPGESGIENVVEARQMGTGNSSQIAQQGDYNNALTEQGLTEDDSANNVASIVQGVANQAENNEAYVKQDGDGNNSFTKQTFDNNESSTIQNGTENLASVMQQANPNQSAGHSATVNQDGMRNQATVGQSEGDRNTSVANQDGNDNRTYQTQTGGSFAELAQDGTNNASTQNQDGSGNIGLVDQGSNALNSQIGTWDVNQGVMTSIYDYTGTPNGDSKNGIAFQDQTGDDNKAYIGQFDGIGTANSAEQIQNGDGNTAYMKQNSYTSAGDNTNGDGGGNIGKQMRTNNGSIAGLVQLGRRNVAVQNQHRNDDVFSIQDGRRNLLNTVQAGGQNIAHTIQIGDDNQAFVTQNMGQGYVVEQGLNSLMSSGNTVQVHQYGPGGAIPNPDPSSVLGTTLLAPTTNITPQTALSLTSPF